MRGGGLGLSTEGSRQEGPSLSTAELPWPPDFRVSRKRHTWPPDSPTQPAQSRGPLGRGGGRGDGWHVLGANAER